MVDRFCGRTVARNACNKQACAIAPQNDCMKLKEQLRIVDFSIIDTVLYLNAYPESKEALKYYHKLREERKMIMDTLAESCNIPVTHFDNCAEDRWTWIDSPWPWQIAAN